MQVTPEPTLKTVISKDQYKVQDIIFYSGMGWQIIREERVGLKKVSLTFKLAHPQQAK